MGGVKHSHTFKSQEKLRVMPASLTHFLSFSEALTLSDTPTIIDTSSLPHNGDVDIKNNQNFL